MRRKVGKIKYTSSLADLFVQAEFNAVIQGQGLPPVWRQGLQQPDHGFSRGCGLSGFQRCDQGKQGFSFHQGQDSSLAVTSDKGIPLPVPVPGQFVHTVGPLLDTDPVGDKGPHLSPGTPAPSSSGLPQMRRHNRSPSRIFVNKLVNGFRAYPHLGISGRLSFQSSQICSGDQPLIIFSTTYCRKGS